MHTSVAFDNKMWVIGGFNSGGYKNDVWYSTDGADWTCATNSAPWAVRDGHTSLVFDNKMWVIGGTTDGQNTFYNDIWYSTDGENWTQATASAGWSARYAHASAVYDNKMWVMGGYDATKKSYNDAWSSIDGVTWTQETASAGWSIRCYFTAAVLNNKMYVMGGYDSKETLNNEVWYYEGTSGVSEDKIPLSKSLLAFKVICPNAFNSGVRIVYKLPESALTKACIYNISGQEIKVLCSGRQAAGSHALEWNGIDYSGRSVTAGVYFIRLSVDNCTQCKTIAFTR